MILINDSSNETERRSWEKEYIGVMKFVMLLRNDLRTITDFGGVRNSTFTLNGKSREHQLNIRTLN